MDQSIIHTTLCKYLEAFCAKDFEQMFSLCTLTWQSQNSENALKSLFEGKTLTEYRVKSITPVNAAGYALTASADLLINNQWWEAPRIMMIPETAPYSPLLSTDEPFVKSHMGINPVSLLRLVSHRLVQAPAPILGSSLP